MSNARFTASFRATDDSQQPLIPEFRCDISFPIDGQVIQAQSSTIPHSTTKTLFDLTEPTQEGIMDSFKGFVIQVVDGSEADIELEITAPEDDDEGDRVSYFRVRVGGLFVLTDGRGRSDPTDSDDFDGEIVNFTKVRVRNTASAKTATIRWAILN